MPRQCRMAQREAREELNVRQSWIMPLVMQFMLVGPSAPAGEPSYLTARQVERSEEGCDTALRAGNARIGSTLLGAQRPRGGGENVCAQPGDTTRPMTSTGHALSLPLPVSSASNHQAQSTTGTGRMESCLTTRQVERSEAGCADAHTAGATGSHSSTSSDSSFSAAGASAVSVVSCALPATGSEWSYLGPSAPAGEPSYLTARQVERSEVGCDALSAGGTPGSQMEYSCVMLNSAAYTHARNASDAASGVPLSHSYLTRRLVERAGRWWGSRPQAPARSAAERGPAPAARLKTQRMEATSDELVLGTDRLDELYTPVGCASSENRESPELLGEAQHGQGPDGAEPCDETWAGYVASHARNAEEAQAIIAAVNEASASQGVDPALLVALIQKESNLRPNARGAAGEIGLCQLMPATARMVGYTNPTGIRENVLCGATHLGTLLDNTGGDYTMALEVYNGGPRGPRIRRCQRYAEEVQAIRSEILRAATHP